MKILKSTSSAQKLASKLRQQKKIIGFVPTMGYLHNGHLSLIKTAKKKSNVLFVSIFVNPLQFAPNEDFKLYPRNFKRDKKLCGENGVDYLFYPSSKELYKGDFSTYVDVENISNILEKEFRPAHFRGVATVVLKLFNIIQPHIAVFGLKDAQQLHVVKKITLDLNLNTKIISGKTIRDKNGLALSSRNIYLNSEQRKDATVLYRALRYAKRKIEAGYNRDLDFLSKQMYKLIKSMPTVTKIDYISFNDNKNLKLVKSLKEIKKNTELLASLAVRFGKIRLIDNILIKY